MRLYLKHLSAFKDCVKGLFATAVIICLDGNFNEETLTPFIAQEPLRAIFSIPDKQDAIRKHRSRFSSLQLTKGSKKEQNYKLNIF